MLLVPRQLKRSGMTGAVPYYGGRLTPAQAYAASHPQWSPPGGPSGASNRPPTATQARAALPPRPDAPDAPDASEALESLLDSGVLTPDEYQRLLARTRR